MAMASHVAASCAWMCTYYRFSSTLGPPLPYDPASVVQLLSLLDESRRPFNTRSWLPQRWPWQRLQQQQVGQSAQTQYRSTYETALWACMHVWPREQRPHHDDQGHRARATGSSEQMGRHSIQRSNSPWIRICYCRSGQEKRCHQDAPHGSSPERGTLLCSGTVYRVPPCSKLGPPFQSF